MSTAAKRSHSRIAVAGTAFATIFVFPASAWAAVDFAAAVNYAAGSGPMSVATGDFDGDGNTDLATANYSSDDVSVLIGNGDGTFDPPVSVSVGDGPQDVAVGDFDGDGDSDLVTANYGTNDITVRLGNGNGTFDAAVSYAVGTAPEDVAVGDLNGDGNRDIVVANPNSSNVSILLGNGDGTFDAAVPYAAGASARSVAIGDLNGDSDPDLAVINTGGDLNVLLGNGDGTFDAATPTVVGGSLGAVVAGDLDGDGDLDLAVSVSNSLNVTVMKNDGSGAFSYFGYSDVGSAPFRLAIADLDGDGTLDLAIPNIGSDNISLLFGNGDGTFAAAINHGAGTFPQHVAIGDFNGDAKPDLAAANSGSNDVSMLLNDPTFATGPTATIGGTVRQGQTLTADEGSPDPTPESFSYKWFADGVEIAGQTANTLLLTSAQVGKKIHVEVTATKSGLNDATDPSPETVPVVGIFTQGPTASISGHRRVGSTLTANAGSLSPTPTAYAYKWYANGALQSSTTKSLKLTTAHYGKNIQVRIYVLKSGYLTANSLSSPTARIGNLQAKTISMELNDYNLKRGQRVYAEIELLASGERWSIVLDGKTLASGKASSKGIARTAFTVPTNAILGERILRAYGAFPDRTDPDRIKIH